MHIRRKTFRWFIILIIAGTSFSLGFVTDLSDNYFEISKNLDIFGKLYREVNSQYVDDTDPSRLMRTGIDAMLSSLDPYTTFIGEEDLEDFRFMSTGQYGGIGAIIGKRENQIYVIEAYEGYPADRAGLRAGDRIIKIGEREVSAKEFEVVDVRNLLRGEKGTRINVEVLRKGVEGPLTLTLERDKIKVKNVPYAGMINEEIGYIALMGFTKDAHEEVRKSLHQLKKENPELKGLILDLRGNPGGLLDQAIRVSNVFVPRGEKIVETRGRMDGSQTVHQARSQPADTEIPLAVLVDRRSASAAEIVAGCLQDLDRGVIVGQRSFGKGLVQNIRPLGYNAQLKVTTAKYYTPSGRCIQAINYADRNEDGSVARIPDSLKSAFQTRNGRTVYDGGGIEPDIEIEPLKVGTMVAELNRQGLIFDFATQYAADHPDISAPDQFEVDDNLYRSFMAYVNEQQFDYENAADRQLDKLVTILEKEGYDARLEANVEALDTKLESLKDKDMLLHQEEVSDLLRREIVKRYYYSAGAIQTSLRDDQEIAAALEVLVDRKSYDRILGRSTP